MSFSETDSEYLLLSSTRYDPQLRALALNTDANGGTQSPYFLLPHHISRLLDATQLHGWPTPSILALPYLEGLCNNAVHAAEDGIGHLASTHCYRIRILLSDTGALSAIATPAAPLPVPDPMAASTWLPSESALEPPSFGQDLLIIHRDITSTPSSLFTRTKTTRRDHYTAARDRFKIPPPPTPSVHEVVLYNQDGDITETSIRNIAFLRRNPPRWVTPRTSTGCLTGVARYWLLDHGRVVESNEGELKWMDVIEGEYVLTFNGVEGCRLGRVTIQD